MNQTGTARYIMFTILAMGIVFSVSGLVAGQIIQTADATDPKHRDNNDNNPTASQNVGSSPSSGTTDVGSGSGSDITSFGTDTPLAQQQLAIAQEASTSPSCGQVVSGQVDLSANLNCSGDGIIVDSPNTVINMNGFSITGPGKDTSKVGIMVSNVENVKVNGPGSVSNFQAGVLLTGSNGFMINSVILSGNQIGAFMTGAENAQIQQNIIQDNGIGVASHSSTGAAIDSNLMNGNLLAGITFVNTQQSNIGMNNIVGSQNGIFLDGQSRQNTISSNNALGNIIDLNNANGLPTNINANQYVDNSCETSNPSGLCIGR